MTGTIKFIHLKRLFGFITGDDNKEYFFHSSDLRNLPLRQVNEGEKCEFDTEITDKGNRARNINVD